MLFRLQKDLSLPHRFCLACLLATFLATPANAQSISELDVAIERWWETKPNASAVVVRLGNKVVYEHYPSRQKSDDLMPIYSVTKSVASILAGIALHQGHIKTLDTPIADYLTKEMAERDKTTRSITLRDLLSMSTGLKSSWAVEGKPITSFRGDLDKRALALPQTDNPGKVSRYSTLIANLMSSVLERATKQEFEAFTKSNLFEPLGITDWSWHRDDSKRVTTGAGLRMKTTDMAKLGQLVLNGGTYNGKRLLDAAYLSEAASSLFQMELPDGEKTGYGFLFWQSNDTPGEHFIAEGFGQQIVYGINELELVVAVSSPCCSGVGGSSYALVEDYIVPALEGR